MAKNRDNNSESVAQRVSSPKVNAGGCPISKRHENTKVYKTVGRTRYCRCDDCGHTWKQTGPFADELREYAFNLADTLAKAPRSDQNGETVIMITSSQAKTIESDLRELAAT